MSTDIVLWHEIFELDTAMWGNMPSTCTYTSNMRVFDTSFNYKTDRPSKSRPDPDKDSPQLRADHELLWTKDLPSGIRFAPSTAATRPNEYLIFTDSYGARYCYGSDAITNSYTGWLKPQPLVEAMAGLNEQQRSRYLNPPYTIGSAMNERPASHEHGTRVRSHR
jgi:hypothetical protein